ncbi:YheT family hydrolase [Psychrobacter lutiphocae]|uniref:YheT family hydrolase n=1 Tax=Psychrobacter lutiphocae TaxID=540500 RepID=UPI00037580BE|nr:alpha/beta fold hydrolase [Psychrobacter lutiphocae]
MLNSLADFNIKPFKTPLWLANPHIQTILPKFTMADAPSYRRALFLDSLNESEVAYDFYDAAESKPDPGKRYKTPIVVLFHGLEGSSQSHYARTLGHYVHAQGWHYVVAHFRSCGGTRVNGSVFYEAGDSFEVHHTLAYLTKRYESVYAVGTSLGGNVLAKYMGEYGDDALCNAASIISAPLELASSSMAMDKLLGRRIYTPYLLNPIINKALEYALSDEELAGIKASRRLSDFDHAFTAPRHGYRSKNDYYRQASAMPHLIGIKKPTMIVTALDDPFLGIIPSQADVSNKVLLCETKHGGHIGFINWKNKKINSDWMPEASLSFFKNLHG